MKKLSQAMSGEQGFIAKVEGDTRFLSRVTSIGLTPGSPITVVINEKKRPLLIYSRDTMIALNRTECERIHFQTEN